MTIFDLPTPALLLDEKRLRQNCAAMQRHVDALGTTLRPHLKTCKNVEVADIAVQGDRTRGVCVSTVAELEYFAAHGYSDILYAVGLVPAKVERLAAVARRAKVRCVIDNEALVQPLNDAAASAGIDLNLLVELDIDGYRAGASAQRHDVVRMVRAIAAAPRLNFDGLMSYPGATYGLSREQARLSIAQHRDRLIELQYDLIEQGIACPVTSLGASPATMAAERLTGITETRAGVYMFMDLAQVGLGVARREDMAVSVLASVISVQPTHRRAIVDAGALAMSQDRSTADMAKDYGYGLVEHLTRPSRGELILARVSQEHGIITSADPHDSFAEWQIGERVRIWPNHVCITAAGHETYHVVDDGKVTAQWTRCRGW